MAKFRGYFILLGFIVAPPFTAILPNAFTILSRTLTMFMQVSQSNGNFLA